MKPPKSESYREWTTNPETVHIAREVKRELATVYLRDLLRACRSSSDADVRGALQRYETAEQFIRLLEGKTNDRIE